MEQGNLEPRAAKILADLMADPDPALDYLRKPEYEPELRAWAHAEATCDLLREWIDRQDVELCLEALEGAELPGWFERKLAHAFSALYKALTRADRAATGLGIKRRDGHGPAS